MKKFLLALLLTLTPLSVVAAAPVAVQPQIEGVVVFEVDEAPQVLVFVYDNGDISPVSAQDCLDNPACVAEARAMQAAKRVAIYDVKTGDKI